MGKALIVYGSETGNTKAASAMVAETLKSAGVEVEMHDVVDVDIDILKEPADIYLLGVSTWGAIDDEVTEDYKSFHEAMRGADLSGKKVAVFGCGDTGYENFAKAVDFVAARAEGQGAQVVGEHLKINLDPNNSKDAIIAWAKKLPTLMG